MSLAPDLRLVSATPLPRPLPASIEAECAVLGSILLNNEAFARVRGFLKPEHFTEDLNRTVYTVAAQTIDAGKLASPLTLRPFLPELPGSPTMAEYLARLAGAAVDSGSIARLQHYAEMVFDLAQRREMIDIARYLEATAYNAPPAMNSASVAYSVVGELQELAAKAAPASTRLELGGAAGALLTRAAAIINGDEPLISFSTGFTDLDRVLGGGYRPGTLVIAAGRPGQGKTAFMTTGSRRCAQKGTGCLAFSFEVDKDEIVCRHLTDLAYRPKRPIPYQDVIRARGLSDEDLWCLEDAQNRLAGLPLVIDIASGLTVGEIASRVRAEKQRFVDKGLELRVVFIDHLRFIKSENRYAGNANKETGEKTRALKQLAKDEAICVVLLSQLSRETERREDKRPTLSDLRDSGEIEEDADVVIFLYREHYYAVKKPAFRANDIDAMADAEAVKFKCELIVDKNRAGPVKTVHLWCDVSASTMDNARQEEAGW